MVFNWKVTTEAGIVFVDYEYGPFPAAMRTVNVIVGDLHREKFAEECAEYLRIIFREVQDSPMFRALIDDGIVQDILLESYDIWTECQGAMN